MKVRKGFWIYLPVAVLAWFAPVSVGKAEALTYTTTGPDDYFFTLDQPQVFTVRAFAWQYGIDSMLWLYDANNNLIAANDDWYGLDSNISLNLDAGYYRLRTGVCCGNPNQWYGSSYVIDVNLAPVNATTTTTSTTTTTTTTTVPETTTTTTITTTTEPETTTTTTTVSVTTTTQETTTTSSSSTTTSTTEPATTTTVGETTTTTPTTTTSIQPVETTTTTTTSTTQPPSPPSATTTTTIQEWVPPAPVPTVPPTTVVEEPTTTTVGAPQEETTIPTPVQTTVPVPVTTVPATPKTSPETTVSPATTQPAPITTLPKAEETVQKVTEAISQLTTVGKVTDEVLTKVLDAIGSGTLNKGQVQEVVAAVLQADLGSDQATQLATSPTVIQSVTGEQAAEIFASVSSGDLTAEEAAAIVAAVQDAPTEVKEAFEAEINVFEGGFDEYVPTGSVISVGARRVIVAVTAVSFVVPVPAVSRRRSKV